MATRPDGFRNLPDMNGIPVAGTYRLDGMLQGSLPPVPGLANDLRAWIESARSAGLHFHLSTDGPGFALVTDPAVLHTSRLGSGDLSKLVGDALEAFVTLVPEESRRGLFSTVRSEEFRPGMVIQVVYAIRPDGKIAVQSREVAVDTADPRPELTPASLRVFVKPLAALLAVMLVISFFFVDYRKLFTTAKERVTPLAKEEVTIDPSASGKLFEIELTDVDPARSALKFHLKRGADWERALASPPQECLASWQEFAARLAIYQGRMGMEFLDKDGNLLGRGTLHIGELHRKPAADVEMSANLSGRLSKIIIRP